MGIRRLATVGLIALLAAIAVPTQRPGIGWLIAAIPFVLFLATGGDVIWLIPATALISISAIRSAEWLFVLCVCAAMLLAAISVVSGRSTRDICLALPRWGMASIRALAWARGGLNPSDRHGAVRLAWAGAIGLALVVLFAALLSSAEPVFGGLMRSLLTGISPWRVTVFVVVAMLCLGAAYPAYQRKAARAEAAGISESDGSAGRDEAARRGEVANLGDEGPKTPLQSPRPASDEGPTPSPQSQRPAGAGRREARSWGRWEWALPVSLVDLLFATFAVVQFTVLFGGHDHVLDPDGPTYAEYARGGFVQLAAVAVLTLGVVAVVMNRIAAKDTPLARVLVGALCALTLVIVGSAMWRMRLYVDAFGFTRMRLVATAFIVWVGLILLLVLALGRRELMPRLILASGVLVLFGLAIANPDRIVAQTVIGRWEKDGHLDAPYLAKLSPDALAALEKLPDPKRSCITNAIQSNYRQRDGWREWNAARARLGPVKGTTDNGTTGGYDCTFYLRHGYRQEGNWVDPSQLPHRQRP